MSGYWDPFNLMQLPLSAYTPGQGDKSMEGGWETASGEPVYTYEMFKAGNAPYVTGATSMKNPSGALVYRTIGDQQVPVRITDHGPGVKGIDIASSNKQWGSNFPYQGATDTFQPPNTPAPLGQPMMAGGPDGLSASQFGQQTLASGLGSGHPLSAYASALGSPSTASSLGSSIGSALGKLGQGMQQQGQQGMQQALAMLHSDPRAQQALAQLAANPLMYLQNIRT